MFKHVIGNVFGMVFNSLDVNVGNTGKRSNEAMSIISNKVFQLASMKVTHGRWHGDDGVNVQPIIYCNIPH